MTDSWPDLYAGPWLVDGNAAKVKALHELRRVLAASPGREVLDVGCIGLAPFHFWEPLLGQYGFRLTGIDVGGIDRGLAILRQRGWEGMVTLLEASGYHLVELFGRERFDIVVATQLLEHLANPIRFLRQVYAVLRPGGEGFLTLDSAHSRPRYNFADPARFAKNLIKKCLSWIGDERHYDLPLLDREVQRMCQQAKLEIAELHYHNLYPLKLLHNHLLPVEHKNGFMREWFGLEEFLNRVEAIRTSARHLFMTMYLHVQKP